MSEKIENSRTEKRAYIPRRLVLVLGDPVSNAAEYQGVLRFRQSVARALHGRDPSSSRVRLLSLSLTFPPNHTRAKRIFPSLHRLARWFAGRDGESAWLVLDESPTYKIHAHGLAITSRSSRRILRMWRELSCGVMKGNHVSFLDGQDAPWDCERNDKLQRALRNVINYADKDLPSCTIPLCFRVVASGELRKMWRSSTGHDVADENLPVAFEPIDEEEGAHESPVTKTAIVEAGGRAPTEADRAACTAMAWSARSCESCGKDISAMAPTARHCTDSCRHRAWKDKKRHNNVRTTNMTSIAAAERAGHQPGAPSTREILRSFESTPQCDDDGDPN